MHATGRDVATVPTTLAGLLAVSLLDVPLPLGEESNNPPRAKVCEVHVRPMLRYDVDVVKRNMRPWGIFDGRGNETARYVHLQASDVLDAMKPVWDAQRPIRPKNDRPRLRRPRPD